MSIPQDAPGARGCPVSHVPCPSLALGSRNGPELRQRAEHRARLCLLLLLREGWRRKQKQPLRPSRKPRLRVWGEALPNEVLMLLKKKKFANSVWELAVSDATRAGKDPELKSPRCRLTSSPEKILLKKFFPSFS